MSQDLIRQYFKLFTGSHARRPSLGPVWAVLPLNRGKLLAPVGESPYLVLVEAGGRIHAGCVVGSYNPREGAAWTTKRWYHDMSATPRPGGQGFIIDSRERGEGGMAWWLRAAIRAQAARAACDNNYKLPVGPRMPAIAIGFTSRALCPPVVTPATTAWLAAKLGEDPLACAARPAEERQRLLEAAWSGAWLAPGEGVNRSKYHVIAERLAGAAASVAVRAFEDFRALVGDTVPNPARQIAAGLPNPAREVLAAAGIPLVGSGRLRDDGVIAEPTAEEIAWCELLASRETELQAAMRRRLGAIALLTTEGGIATALAAFASPLPAARRDVDDDVAVKVMRRLLRLRDPELAEDAEAADLLAGYKEPHRRLCLPHVCGPQVLYRDPEVHPGDALRFGAVALGEARAADFYIPPGQHAVPRRTHQGRRHAGATRPA